MLTFWKHANDAMLLKENLFIFFQIASLVCSHGRGYLLWHASWGLASNRKQAITSTSDDQNQWGTTKLLQLDDENNDDDKKKMKIKI